MAKNKKNKEFKDKNLVVQRTTLAYDASRNKIMKPMENRTPEYLVHQVFGAYLQSDYFKNSRGTRNHLAIMIYTEIVNWHLQGSKNFVKFNGKILQLSMQKLCDDFGAGRHQVQIALKLLEKNNLIKRHFDVGNYPNQQFIEFNVDLFEEIMSVYEINEIAKAVQDLDKSIDEFVDDEINPEHFTEFSY